MTVLLFSPCLEGGLLFDLQFPVDSIPTRSGGVTILSHLRVYMMMIIVSFSFSLHRVRVGTNFVSMQLVMRFDVDDDIVIFFGY